MFVKCSDSLLWSIYNHKQIIISHFNTFLRLQRPVILPAVLWYLSNFASLTEAISILIQVLVIPSVQAAADLSLGALSKLFLKEAWAALIHSPCNSTYTKEKTTAISSTRSSETQVSTLSSQQDQYSTEIRKDWFNVSLHLPTCLHSPIISFRIFAGWVLLGMYYLSFGMCTCSILRGPTYTWVCNLRKHYH